MMSLDIRFRTNKPALPQPNDKVEISKNADETEFYASVDID
tara:strand:+ start:702 stop:824 length:123 start_codon:yes stop_codon:yes gene_type:complete